MAPQKIHTSSPQTCCLSAVLRPQVRRLSLYNLVNSTFFWHFALSEKWANNFLKSTVTFTLLAMEKVIKCTLRSVWWKILNINPFLDFKHFIDRWFNRNSKFHNFNKFHNCCKRNYSNLTYYLYFCPRSDHKEHNISWFWQTLTKLF